MSIFESPKCNLIQTKKRNRFACMHDPLETMEEIEVQDDIVYLDGLIF
jgi:hypothetical protein